MLMFQSEKKRKKEKNSTIEIVWALGIDLFDLFGNLCG